jgi:hypothetical protein
MITILNNEGNNIIYKCDCGVKGKCMVKPQPGNATIVVDVRCPICLEGAKRVVITQSDGEDFSAGGKNPQLSWSPIIGHEIIDYKIKDEE